MRHIVFYKNQNGVCPLCGGMLRTLRSDEIILNCLDCNVYLKAVGPGQAEAELEFEEVEVGG